MLKRGLDLIELDMATLKWVSGLIFTILLAPFTWFHYRITRVEESKMDVKVFKQFEKRMDGNFIALNASQKSQNEVLGKIFDKLEKKEDKIIPGK